MIKLTKAPLPLAVCIIAVGNLEIPTNRGGGIEQLHYRVGLELARYFHITIVSPFYKRYKKQVSVNDRLTIEEVYYPSCSNYPPKSAVGRYMTLLSMLLYSFLAATKLISLARKGIRIVIVTDILTGLLPAMVAKLLGEKVIFSEGNLWPWTNPYIAPKDFSISQRIMYAIKIRVGIILGRLSNYIRVQSNLIMEGMVDRGMDRTKIIVIKAGIDTNTFKPARESIPLNKFKVGFVGRLTDEKGLHLLLEVCKRAKKVIPEICFKVMGKGTYEKQLMALKNVEYVGWVPKEKLTQFLRDVQAVLFFQRALGLAELEILASGKALIACNSGDTPQTIKHLQNGVLCAPNVKSYTDAIELLVENPILLGTISRKGRQTAKRCFDWRVVSRCWVLLCESCLRGSDRTKTIGNQVK